MRTLTKIFLTVFILIVCFVVITLSQTNTQVAGASMAPPSPMQTSTLQPSNGPGLPAIRPSLSTVAAVRITSADVRSYLQTHPFPAGKLVNGATFTIASLQFVTSKQASKLMKGEETGLTDTAMVCYVKVHGPFILLGASLPPHAKKRPAAPDIVEIFDAQTGNLLMWWAPFA